MLGRTWILITDAAIAYFVKLQPTKEYLNVLEFHALRFCREIEVFITEIRKLAIAHDTLVRFFYRFLVAFLLDEVEKNLFTVYFLLLLDVKLEGGVLIGKGQA